MCRFFVLRSVIVLLSIVPAACGIRTPTLLGFNKDKDDAKIAVNHIVNEVKCELIQGVMKVIDYDKKQARLNGKRKLEWFEDWSAQITLSINVEEQGTFGPGVSYSDPLSSVVDTFSNGTQVTTMRAVTVSAGGGISSTATRNEKLNFFVTFSDFIDGSDPNTDISRPCQHQHDVPLASDLKLDEWIEVALFANLTDSITRPAGAPLPMTAISHEVTFVVRANGHVTPGWKLVPVSFNQGNTAFLSAYRQSRDNVLITIGPKEADPAGKPAKDGRPATRPSQGMLFTHLASEIGTAVADSLGNFR